MPELIQIIKKFFRKQQVSGIAKRWHEEEFEDTKGVIKICKSTKDSQHND
jgi:hypothetical protein